MESSPGINLVDLREEPNERLESVPDQHSMDSTEPWIPRADGGTDAWLFLAACFVIGALVWGEEDVPACRFQPCL